MVGALQCKVAKHWLLKKNISLILFYFLDRFRFLYLQIPILLTFCIKRPFWLILLSKVLEHYCHPQKGRSSTETNFICFIELDLPDKVKIFQAHLGARKIYFSHSNTIKTLLDGFVCLMIIYRQILFIHMIFK